MNPRLGVANIGTLVFIMSVHHFKTYLFCDKNNAWLFATENLENIGKENNHLYSYHSKI